MLRNYLKQPFPKLKSRWKLIILISLFVTIFLILFQPFGIHFMQNQNKLFILSGYGLVTFFVLFINLIVIENLFPKSFNEEKWTIGKEFLWLIWIIFCIGLGNAFYTYIVISDYFRFNLMYFVQFQIVTLTVGLIPASILIISKQKYLLQRNLNSAYSLNKDLKKDQHISSPHSLTRVYSDNEKDYIEFNPNDFYFVESSGNYIDIYIVQDNEIVRKTLRNTLKRALSFLEGIPEIIQCHRAFIVNITKITNAKGNSQGLRLQLKNCEKEVPVSRNYVHYIRTELDN